MAFCFGFRSFFCARVIRARRHILLFYSLFSSWPLWPILSHNLLNNLIPVIMLPVVMWLVQRTDSYWLFSLVNDCSLLLYSGSPVLRYVLSPPIAVWLNWFPLTILVRSFFYRVLRVLCLLLKAPFRKCLSEAGISHPYNFRGHSFCGGAASWAFSCGVPGDLIQLYGEWASDSYKFHSEFILDSKLALATQWRSAIISSSS